MFLDCFNCKRMGLFIGGALFGTAGLKILKSREAKKLYVGCAAAGLRAKDCVMAAASTIQENAEDVLAEARELNKKRVGEEVFEDLDEDKAGDIPAAGDMAEV